MVYGCAPWLIAGRHLICFFQGTQQGDPLGMYLVSLVIQPMIDELQGVWARDLKLWCADEGTLVCTISAIAKTTEILRVTNATLEYHLEVCK